MAMVGAIALRNNILVSYDAKSKYGADILALITTIILLFIYWKKMFQEKNTLQDQYCFRTEKAVSKLQFLKSEKVALV